MVGVREILPSASILPWALAWHGWKERRREEAGPLWVRSGACGAECVVHATSNLKAIDGGMGGNEAWRTEDVTSTVASYLNLW